MSNDLSVMFCGERLDFLVTFQCWIFPPSGFQWPHVSDPVTTDCPYSQLCLVYFCHSLQLWQDAYVTQHTKHDHQRCCLPARNQFAPSVLALPFPIAQSFPFLLPLPCVLGLSSSLWVNSGSPFMVTNCYGFHFAHKPKTQPGQSLKLILYEKRRSETRYTEAAG